MSLPRSLTRRTLIASALAGSGALGLARVAAAFGAATPRAARGIVFSLWVDRHPGAGKPARAASGWLVGPPLRARMRFDLVGVEWSGAREAHVELRVRTAGGGWSRWADASDHGHAPERPRADHGRTVPGGATIGDPVWAGGADFVQLRTRVALKAVRLHFVNSTGTATAGERALAPLRELLGAAAVRRLAAPVLNAGRGQPPILARATWAGGDCRPSRQPGYGRIQAAIVHHTENANDYGAGESPAIVRAIFFFHRDVRGWHDIGYNFLVDKYGQIFEGRAGGIDEPVVGAQAGGFNTQSTGVAHLGSNQSAPVSAAALSALASVIAWKLSLHGLPATGRTTLVVGADGAPYTGFRPGAHVSVNRIAGHRDVDSTDCPGNALYAQLAQLRARVAQLAGRPARLTFAIPVAPVAYSNAARLSGRLAYLDGTPIGAAAIELQARSRGRERTVATATTAPDGSWSASAAASGNVALRALYRGDAAHPATVSEAVGMLVAPAITLAATTPSGAPATLGVPLAAGTELQLSGVVNPPQRRVRVGVYRQGAGGVYALARTLAAPVRGGHFAAALRLRRAGVYELVASTAASARNAAGASPPVYVSVSP